MQFYSKFIVVTRICEYLILTCKFPSNNLLCFVTVHPEVQRWFINSSEILNLSNKMYVVVYI